MSARTRTGNGRHRWLYRTWAADAAQRRMVSVLRARSRREVRRARKAAQR